jgi:hypothetical protein
MEVKMMLEQVRFRLSEVISYLEVRVINDEANKQEKEMYESFVWNGFLDKEKYFNTYNKVLKRMKEEYEEV